MKRLRETFASTSRREGFNLLEIMVAFTILSLVVLTSSATLVKSQTATRESDNYRLAWQIAQKEIERIRSLPFHQAIATTNTQYTPAYGLYGPNDVGSYNWYYSYFFTTDLPGFAYCLTYYDLGESYNLGTYGAVDVNGDGDTTDNALTTSDKYRVLPIEVYVRWEENGVVRSFWQNAVISSRTDFMRYEN